MSTYAISDVHGCFDELQELLKLIKFSSKDTLYILGDLIDRGPANDKCVKWMAEADSNIVYLLGNHELMMMASMNDDLSNFLQNPTKRGIWCKHGGMNTFKQCKKHCSRKTMKAFQNKIENAKVLASPNVGEIPPVLIHAGLKPPDTSDKDNAWMYQDENALLWGSKDWHVDSQIPPFDVVFGHTPTATLAHRLQSTDLCSAKEIKKGKNWHIMHWNRKWAIDCGCVFGGNLAALRLDDYQCFYVPCHKEHGYT